MNDASLADDTDTSLCVDFSMSPGRSNENAVV